MGTVQVFTKDRMLAIENSSVVGGTVNVDGNLILTRKDGTTINAGDVKRLLPSRLGATNNLGANNNPDTLTDSGWYSGYNWAGSLTGYGIGTLETIQYSPDWIIQKFTLVDVVPKMFVRARYSGTTWGSWAPIPTKSMVDAAIFTAVSPLDQNAFTVTTPARSFPFGVSLMIHDPAVGWPVNTYGIVRTERGYKNQESGGTIQYWNSYYGDSYPEHGKWFREWGYLATVWGPWRRIKTDIEVTAIGSMGSIVGGSTTPFNELVLTGGFTSPDTKTLVIPAPGLYNIQMSQLVSAPSAGYYQCMVNNVDVYHAYTPGTMVDLHVNITRKLAVGDTIRFFYNGATPSSWAGTHSNLSIYRA